MRIFPFIKKMNSSHLPLTANLRKFKDYFSYISIEYHRCMIHTPELYSGGRDTKFWSRDEDKSYHIDAMYE